MMNKSNDYVICTDSSADIPENLLQKLGVISTSLTLRFVGESEEYKNCDVDIVKFYEKMRKGVEARTSAPSIEDFISDFDSCLRRGLDVLYLGFSSALSNTYNCARLAAESIQKNYPDRKIITVDTLCASLGCALLIDEVLKKKREGASIEEASEFAEKTRLNICHWFTVDDLVYLKRGGRVSPTVAFVGNMLGIKPILHVDNEGRLVKVGKARGRRASINELADKYGKFCTNMQSKIYISHADSPLDAELLSQILKEKFGVHVDLISNVGPVIGAHSGPGTLALFFIGEER